MFAGARLEDARSAAAAAERVTSVLVQSKNLCHKAIQALLPHFLRVEFSRFCEYTHDIKSDRTSL
jgi:hypothetical protein